MAGNDQITAIGSDKMADRNGAIATIHHFKNVYHELGFLMRLNQSQGLPHENFLLLHNESISNAADDVGFNLSNVKQIRVNDSNNLREQLKQQLAIYYGLTELGD